MSKSLLEQFENNLSNASLVDANATVGGTFIWLPDGLIMRNLFLNEIRNIFKQYSFEEYTFPEFIALDEFNILANNIKDFSKGVYIVDKDRILSPSGECVIYPYFRRKVHTHKDLPIKVYQFGRQFRKGNPRGVLRMNENGPFTEIHSAHATRHDAENQVLDNIECVKRVMDFLGLPFVFSERPAWSNNPVAEQIFAFDTLLPNGETVHMSSVYSQMQIFSRPFGVQFTDRNGQKDFTYQIEFGFGCRMIFAVLFLTMDEKGLNIPPQIAPHQVVITPIFDKLNLKEIMGYAEKLKDKLINEGFRVAIDDDMKKSIGRRRNSSEVKGVPIRLEIGNSEWTSNIVTLVSRETNVKAEISSFLVGEKVRSMLDDSTRRMKERLETRQRINLVETKSLETIISIVEDGRIADLPLCHMPECAIELERNVKGEVLGYHPNINEESCVICGKQTTYSAFQARHV